VVSNLTLQRINSIEIENFRSYSTKKVFNFENGLNLISGENGAGKTSLRLAIVLGLFSRPGGKGLESIMRSGNKPEVKIEFVAEGGTYIIEKTFSKTPKDGVAILTNLDTNERIDITDEAVLKCRQLVTGSEESIINKIDGNFSPLNDAISKGKSFSEGEVTKILGNNMGSLLFPEQGRLVELFETNDVLKNIGLDKNTLTTNNDLEKLILRANGERTERLTKVKFDFKFDLENNVAINMAANKKLESKFKAARVLWESVDNYKITESKLQEHYAKLESLRSEQESDSEGENLDELAKKLEESAEEHREKRESAEKKTSSASKELEESKQLQNDRESIKKQINELKTEIEVNKSKLTSENENLQKCEEKYETSKKKMDEVKTQISELDSWIDYKGDDSYRQDLQTIMTDCDDELKKIDENNKKIVDIEQVMRKINPASTDQWSKINELRNEISVAKGRLSPWDLNKSNVPSGYELKVDGEEFKEKSGKIKSSLVMTDSKNKVIISISNPEESKSIDELESQLNEIFTSLGVEGTGELRIRQEKFDKLEEGLNDIKNNKFRSKEEIERSKLDSENKLKDRKKKPKSKEPESELTELFSKRNQLGAIQNANEEIRDDLGKELGGLQTSTKNLEDKVQLNEKDNSELNGKLEEHRKLYINDSELVEKLAINRKTFEEAKAVSDPLTSSKETEEDGARKKASNIRKGSENRNRIGSEITECKTLIDHIIKESDYSKYAEAEEKLELAKDELELEVLKTKAIVLLQQSLENLKEDKMESIYPVLQTIINQVAGHLYGNGAKIILNKDGFPHSLVRTGRSKIKFEWESYGTREQLNLLYRLALIRIISDEEETSLCFALDDPLVNSDRLRREKILSHLNGLISKGEHQVLVFTCHAEDYTTGSTAGTVDHHIKL
jgi:DNA repair protein SbcC/Rad50